MSAEPVLSAAGLRVRFGAERVLHDIDLDAWPGRVHVVLGPSGSGKTTLLRALIGLVPPPGRVDARALVLRPGGTAVDLGAATPRHWRALRGRHVGLVAQDPGLALTPLRRVGSLIREVDRAVSPPGRRRGVPEVLRESGLADVPGVADRCCFQLSGGMAQRLGLGLALAGRPSLVLADEPSTALDGIARAALVATLRAVADEGRAVVLVTHDPVLAAGLADDVTVLEAGRVVAAGDRDVVHRPAPRPPRQRPTTRPAPTFATPSAPPALSLRGLRKGFADAPGVLAGVDLEVGTAEVVGLAGRSGAGKTTLLRHIVGLETPDAGVVRVGGLDPDAVGWRRIRRQVQLVAQDPRGALNPWRTAVRAVTDPMDDHRVDDRVGRRRRARELLARVGLDGYGDRRPGQLSTGQCQRVAIARALAVRPRLLVADEPVAALDAALREDILTLLRDVATAHGTAALVISHDLAALERLCDRIVVLDGGRIVEDLPAAGLRDHASHPLTRALLRGGPAADSP